MGHPLPVSYRDYLRQCDGGRLAANHEAVKTVFGIGDVPDRANLQDRHGYVRDLF